jgi:uncharacterized protein YajQ (UPF0234 family)
LTLELLFPEPSYSILECSEIVGLVERLTISWQVAGENAQQLEDVLLTKAMRQGLEANCFDLTKTPNANGKYIRKTIPVKNGIDKDYAKKIVKIIKDSGLKVQAAIMDDVIRVTAKKIDDLQEVIALCRSSNIDLPLQFINMKS